MSTPDYSINIYVAPGLLLLFRIFFLLRLLGWGSFCALVPGTWYVNHNNCYSKVLICLHPTVYWWNGDSIYRGDWDGFWQFRGQRRPIGIIHGGTFLTAFSRRSFWWYFCRHRTPLQIMAKFGGESFQLINPGTTSCIFCGECRISCGGPIRFKNKIHQIDRILRAVKMFRRERSRSDVFALKIAKKNIPVSFM